MTLAYEATYKDEAICKQARQEFEARGRKCAALRYFDPAIFALLIERRDVESGDIQDLLDQAVNVEEKTLGGFSW